MVVAYVLNLLCNKPEKAAIMYEHLQTYLGKDIYPFHMPGHKRNPMFFPPGMADLDLTEIPGMDILRTPTGVIRDMQDVLAISYDSDESYLLVNGSTAGVTAAICAVCNEGDKLYAARNGHVSMFNGMALAGAEPVYILPEMTYDGLAGGIVPEALNHMEEGAVVFVVSPTYEGFISDIKTIAEKVHSHGGVLIVDEAHGAHLRFHDTFPESALNLGADIVIQSFHKTLPVLGQMAILHVKSRRIDLPRLRFFLQAMQTTSPSYMLMGQLDYVMRMLWKRPEVFDMYVSRLDALRKALSAEAGQAICLSGLERLGRSGIHDIDQCKLLFYMNIDENVINIPDTLSAEYRLQVEMATGRHLLAMTSVADTDEGMQRLWSALGSLNIRLENSMTTYYKNPQLQNIDLPEIVLPPRQAVRQETEVIPWEHSAGRIAGEIIAAYPPGIVQAAPGERIPHGLPKLASEIRVVK